MDLQATLQTTISITRSAGAVALQYFEQPHQIQTKKNKFDIVTEADKATEKVIVAALTAAFPTHHIVGEEGGGMGAPPEEAQYFWYVDPIDGTSNFAGNIPYFSVSIALSDAEQQPLVGVVMNPVYDELFAAARGHGMIFNGKSAQVSATPTLADAIIASDFPSNHSRSLESALREWTAFSKHGVRGLRRFGSAALDLASVAIGRLDAYWENDLNPWDCMAGILLVQEAGGRVSDRDGGTDKLYSGAQVVSSNGHLHADILAILNGR